MLSTPLLGAVYEVGYDLWFLFRTINSLLVMHFIVDKGMTDFPFLGTYAQFVEELQLRNT